MAGEKMFITESAARIMRERAYDVPCISGIVGDDSYVSCLIADGDQLLVFF